MTWDYVAWRASFNTSDGAALCCGSSIHLRPLQLEDTDEILRWRNQPFVRSHFIYQQDFTRAGHLHWFGEQLLSGSAMQFLIVANADERHLGSIYLRDIDWMHQKAEFGIFLWSVEDAGHGIGTEAARLLLRYAFDSLHLHRVYLRVFADNARAIAAYQKAGFQMEGRLRESVCIDGQYRDLLLMAAVTER